MTVHHIASDTVRIVPIPISIIGIPIIPTISVPVVINPISIPTVIPTQRPTQRPIMVANRWIQ